MQQLCQKCQSNSGESSIIISNICPVHRQQYNSVALKQSKETKIYKACKECEKSRSMEKFFSLSEIKEKLGNQDTANLITEIQRISQKIIQQSDKEKQKLIQLSQQISEIIMNGIFQIYHLQELDDINLFSALEIFHLLTPSTIKTFEQLKDRQISILNADDISSMLLTKILFDGTKTKQFLKELDKNSQSIQKHLQNKIENLTQFKEKISTFMEQKNKQPQKLLIAPKVVDLSLDFQRQKQKQNNVQELQKVDDESEDLIKKIKGEKQQISKENVQNPQIKAIMNLDQDSIAYASRTNIYILEKKNKSFKQIQQLELEEEETITFATSIQNAEKIYIIAGVEAPNVYKIGMWNRNQNWQQYRNFEAHSGTIQRIIYFSQNNVITCSEDRSILKINFEKQSQEVLIQEQQQYINDMTLINEQTIIYITSDQIGVFDCNKKTTIKMTQGNEKQISIQAINPNSFVVGNSYGQIQICTFADEIETQQSVNFHQSDVKYIFRIDSKKFVTSSYDGTHLFFSLDGKLLNSIQNGPKNDFPDPIFWDRDLKCLIASSGGILYYYY